MRIHHLDCGTMNCLGGALVGGSGAFHRRHPMVAHVLLVETEAGLVLVDTGLGLGDCEAPKRLGFGFNFGFAPALTRESTAFAQVQALGFRVEDVRHILLTHLDLDHAGGLGDFPNARVHVLADEHSAAMARKSLKDKSRYLPAQWKHDVQWELYPGQGESWFGFERVAQLRGLPPDFGLVPLTGHTLGHAGIAIQRSDGWLLHCGDAYFHGATLQGGKVPGGLALFESSVAVDRQAMHANQAKLKALAQDDAAKVKLFSAHDPFEFAAALAQAQSAGQAPIQQAG